MDWLRAYVDAYLIPLVHSFYAYELVSQLTRA